MWGPDGKDCLTLFQPIRNGTKNCLTIFGWHSGWPLSLTRLDTGRAPIKWWQVLEAQIWVLARCFFRSEWNAVSLLGGQTLFTNSWSHVPNSFHCDAFLPRKSCGNHFTSGVLICRGRSLQKQVKRVKNRWKESPSHQIANFCPSPNPFSLHWVKLGTCQVFCFPFLRQNAKFYNLIAFFLDIS